MADAIQEIDRLVIGPCVFVSGVGAHQQWAARLLTLDYPKRMLISSCGHGTMGSGIPMAIGAALERGRVVVVNGDGSMCMDAMHLITLKEHNSNVKVFVLDNSCGGIVKQFEDLKGYNHVATEWPSPDFAMIAAAQGLGVGQTIEDTLSLDGPALCHLLVDDFAVWPILEAGSPPDRMTYG
jgi:acetolactate synthase-1/2/3 large subunit